MTEKAFIKETNAYGRLCNYTFKVLGVNYVVRKIKRLSFISQDVWFRGGGGCHMNHCPLIIEGGSNESPRCSTQVVTASLHQRVTTTCRCWPPGEVTRAAGQLEGGALGPGTVRPRQGPGTENGGP